MFGKSILVAPVVQAQYTPEKIKEAQHHEINGNIDFKAEKSRTVYLPAGCDWYDYWTNEKLQGGQEIARKTALDMIPLYVREGAIIPIGPKVQFAQEKRWDNLEIKLYPGKDGFFTLYEDEFDNYNYEKGAYTEIDFIYNDKLKKLTLSNRRGQYKGMLFQRSFTIVMPDGTKTGLTYKGRNIEHKL
jgi:alpha-D-xyloside xylohydrolase